MSFSCRITLPPPSPTEKERAERNAPFLTGVRFTVPCPKPWVWPVAEARVTVSLEALQPPDRPARIIVPRGAAGPDFSALETARQAAAPPPLPWRRPASLTRFAMQVERARRRGGR